MAEGTGLLITVMATSRLNFNTLARRRPSKARIYDLTGPGWITSEPCGSYRTLKPSLMCGHCLCWVVFRQTLPSHRHNNVPSEKMLQELFAPDCSLLQMESKKPHFNWKPYQFLEVLKLPINYPLTTLKTQ